MASVTDLYSSLEGWRVRENDGRPVRHGEIMLAR